MAKFRGADTVARALARGGVTHLFSLSGNHIMPLYDAALDVPLPITHTRHEGAAVHMADAWGRLTGVPGVALLTGGPGHANGIGALYTALASESPMVLLSGHAPLRELGLGSFQEMAQADMAAPVAKASWTAQRAETLGEDIARAMRTAAEGRPGPVHLSLPFDLLEAEVERDTLPSADAFGVVAQKLGEAAADAVLTLLSQAQRPLLLCGAVLSTGRGDDVREQLATRLGVPVICMESPRGLNDPAQGALAHVVSRADVVVLLGKQPDFTLRFGQAPAMGADCRIVVIEPEAAALQRTLAILGERVVLAMLADSVAAARALAARGTASNARAWVDEVQAALRLRPPEWALIAAKVEGPVHPVEVGRAVQDFVAGARDVVLISDGGEFGQWAQACVSVEGRSSFDSAGATLRTNGVGGGSSFDSAGGALRTNGRGGGSARIINGQGGSIGSAIPFALAAKTARPDAMVVAMTGDGACGFHLLELETAVRAGLAFIVVVGNDACWNAEHQIQLRTYGQARAHACELPPARYDQVAIALGAHGELVTRTSDLPDALRRAAASGKPALVNVMIERLPAPTVGAPTRG